MGTGSCIRKIRKVIVEVVGIFLRAPEVAVSVQLIDHDDIIRELGLGGKLAVLNLLP